MASEVLQEFLVRLRFDVDKGGEGKYKSATSNVEKAADKAQKNVNKSSSKMASNFNSDMESMSRSANSTSQAVEKHGSAIGSSLGKIGKGTIALGVAAVGAAVKVNSIGERYIQATNAATFAVRRLGVSSIQNFKAMNYAAEAVGLTTSEIASTMENLNNMKFKYGAQTANQIQQALLAPNINANDTEEERLNKIAVHANQQYKANPNNSITLMANAEAAGINPQMMQYMMQYGNDYKKKYDEFNPAVGSADDANAAKALEIKNTEMFTNALLEGKAAASEMTKAYIDQRLKFDDFLLSVVKSSSSNEAFSAYMAKELLTIDNVTSALGILAVVALAVGGATAIMGGVAGLVGLGGAALLLRNYGKDLGINSLLGSVMGNQTGDSDNQEPLWKSAINDTTNKIGSFELGVSDTFKNMMGDNSTKQLFNEFKALKYSDKDAADIAANFNAESGGDPFAYGDNNKAYGLGQWHPDRRRDYEKLFGHTMASVKDYGQATKEQILFADWELKNTEKDNWDRGHHDMTHNDSIYSRFIERPAALDADSRKRGNEANEILGKREFNVTQNIYGTNDAKQTGDISADKLKDLINGRYNTQYAN